MNRRSRLGLLLMLAMLMSIGVSAQTISGSIAGTVTDQAGAALSGAAVKIVEGAKSITLSATTDSEGRFVFPTVTPGTYTLSIEASGFKRSERTGLLLVANDKLTLGDIPLDVGATSETVTVTAEATVVQSESAERSYAIQGEIVQNIAVNGRGFVNLASIATGVVFNNNVANSDAITNVSANGLRTSANNLQLDGVAIVDTGNNGTMISVNLDAIAEFKVLTSNYQAEFGRSAGAQISAVTKGGGRDFHGSFYAFRRHDGMNANTWLNNRNSTATNRINKPRLDQRDIGYTIGGPVYIPGVFNKNRDKLFFFFSQEHQKRFIPPAAPVRVTVPTALERAGDFSQTRDNAGNLFPYIRDYTLNLPCNAGNTTGCFADGGVLGKIPTNRIYPLGLNILKMYPLPNRTGTVGFNYETEVPASRPERQDLFRGDWNVTDAWRVSGKYLYNKRQVVEPYGSFVLGTNMPDFQALYPNDRYSFTGTVTGTISSTLVFEATFGQSHNSIDILPGNSKFNRAGFGLGGIPLLFPNAVQIDSPPRFIFNGGRIANGPNIGSNNSPFYNFNTTRDFAASVAKIAGSHNFKAGVFWQNSFKPQSSFAANNGDYNFVDNAANPFDSQFGFANAATGVYNTFNQASDYVIGKYRYNNIEWFVQDNWKATSRLTLDYGVRFYFIEPTFGENDTFAFFDPASYDKSKQPKLIQPGCLNNLTTCSGANRIGINPVNGQVLPSVKIGTFAPGSGTPFQGMSVVNERVVNTPSIKLAPRVGFAYDVFGDGKTSIRGGIGFFFDRFNDDQILQMVEMPPNMITATANFTTIKDLLSTPLSVSPIGVFGIQRDYDPPTVYNYSFGIQRDIGFKTVVDVSYVGSLARHMLQRRSINSVPYGGRFATSAADLTIAAPASGDRTPLPDNFLRPYLGYGDINYLEFASNSNYHALQTSINRRFSNSFSLGVAYTWSKAMDLVDGNGNNINPFIDPKVRNYGKAGFDRTHNMTINYIYKVPGLSSRLGNNGIAKQVFDNWEISGITTFLSGSPLGIGYSLVQGTDIIGGSGGGLDSRVVLIGNPILPKGERTFSKFFNTGAVRPPTRAELGIGNAAKDLIRGPGTNNWDISLFKTFELTRDGGVRLQYRLETFNTFNHTQFNGVDTSGRFDLNTGAQVNALFGSYTSAANARRIVMALKLMF